MLVYSPLLAGVFLATVPLYARAHALLVAAPAPDLRRSGRGASAATHSHQIDAIKGIETVKALGAEVAFRELMLNQFHRLARRQFRADFTIMTYEGAVSMVTLPDLGALPAGSAPARCSSGQLTIGALVAFNALVAWPTRR